MISTPAGFGASFHSAMGRLVSDMYWFHTCAFGVFSRYFECALLYVGTDDGYLHGAFGAVVVVYLVEEVGVEVAAMFQRRTACGICPGLCWPQSGAASIRKCAGSAHQDRQRGFAAPAAFEYYAGGEHLVDGCLGLLAAPAAFMERFAGGVERQGWHLGLICGR